MEPRASGLLFGAAWPFKAYDVHREESFEALMERWVPLTIALNNMSRGMGHNDFYPFVIPAPAYDKLAFVHRTIREYVANPPQPAVTQTQASNPIPVPTPPPTRPTSGRSLIGRVYDRLK
jgi:hypothetical protein